MSSIGEKIKDKLHMGHSSGDDGAHTTKATTAPAAGTTTKEDGMHTGAAKVFTEVEDRPVEKDVVERVVEHRPVEKKYVTETHPAGERELTHKRQEESLGTREHVRGAAPESRHL